MRLIRYLLLLLCFASPAFSYAETWQCDSPNNGVPQDLTVEIEGGKLVMFEYLSSIPSHDGTSLLCSFSAKRETKESEWSDSGEETNIQLKEASEPEDHLIVKKSGETFTFTFNVALSNCGQSTPFAKVIAISKGKKRCHSIDMDH